MAIVVVALLAVLNLGVLLLTKADTSREQTTGLPTAIVALQPRPGELIRPQDTIAVQLRTDLTGALVLDGQEIPDSQLARQPGLGEVSFRPGPGKDLSQLPPGTHTVVSSGSHARVTGLKAKPEMVAAGSLRPSASRRAARAARGTRMTIVLPESW